MLNQTTETLNIQIPSGTLAPETFEKKFRKDFKTCTGVVGYIVKQAQEDKVRIALQDSNGADIFEKVYQDEIIGSINVPSNFRYKPLSIPADGNIVNVIVSPIQELTEDFEMDLVFRIEK